MAIHCSCRRIGPTTDHRPPTTAGQESGGRRYETRDNESDALSSVVVVPTPFDGRSKNLAKLWFEQIGAPLAAARLCADLLHVPYFAPPLLSAVPVIVSILDIIPLLLPEYRGG